ncbi:PRD domain-containing protein [[Clostridium] innocuum]|nr:PRD domain-containing protein [[Clostridium] innocuum]MCR0576391.1 PRD domain-containing protein [[Clostridium] innocuum]
MKSKKEMILSEIQKTAGRMEGKFEFSTTFLAEKLQMQRSNVSTILNQLVSESVLDKINGRPVLYRLSGQSTYNGEESTSFQQLIGYNDSLKNTIQLAKASVMYPDGRLSILLMSEKGSGSSRFAQSIYDYVVEKEIINSDSPYIKINCNYFIHNMKGLRDTLVESENNALKSAENGVLFVDHIHLVPDKWKTTIYDLVSKATNEYNTILIMSSDYSIDSRLKEFIPVKIELPNLKKKKLSERFEFIQKQLINESIKMKQPIHIESYLLNGLLLYPCSGNYKQLQADIRMGCANAYTRSFQSNVNSLYLLFEDFPSYIRKGLLLYKNNYQEVNGLINQDTTYSFENNKVEKIKEEDKNSKTVYEWVEETTNSLKSKGLNMEDIEVIITSDLEKRLYTFTQDIEKENIDKESLSKIVDQHLIELTDQFLDEASNKFKKVYPSSVLYGLCLHLSFAIEHVHNRRKLNKEIIDDMKSNKEEYRFSTQFLKRLEQEFKVQLYDDESALVTMFIIQRNRDEIQREYPVLLIAMHGGFTASSLVDVVSSLTKSDQVYAYDLLLDMDIHDAYEELKALLIEISNGREVLMMYDMGSLKTMGETIAKETGINIHFLVSPTTLLALECARKITMNNNVTEILDDLKLTYESYYPYVMENYKRTTMKNIIVALCMTGEGGAIQIKQYLDKHLDIENAEVIPLAMNNTKQLIDSINHLRETHNILYIIGTENPQLHNIPFISVAQLFSLPASKLAMLLSIGGVEITMKGKMEYARICNNLKEELPGLDIDGIKRILPSIIDQINEKYSLNQDQKVGIFMHLAGSINRLTSNERIAISKNDTKILIKNKTILNDLHDILKPIENYFNIKYKDEELENLIRIIKKI